MDHDSGAPILLLMIDTFIKQLIFHKKLYFIILLQ